MASVHIVCWKCGKKFEYIPNIVPIVKGGTKKAEAEEDIVIRECPFCKTMNRFEYEESYSSDPEDVVILGRNPSGIDTDVEWIKNAGKEYFTKSPDALNAIAKDLVALNSALITAYIAALTLLGLPERGILSSPESLIIIALPIIAWLLGAVGAAVAGFTKTKINLDSTESIKKGLMDLVSNKTYAIGFSYLFLVIGLVLGAYALVGPSYDTTTLDDVQFIVGKDNIAAFENMSLLENNQTMITEPVTLIDESEKTYTVLKKNNETVVFNKDQVVGIKY